MPVWIDKHASPKGIPCEFREDVCANAHVPIDAPEFVMADAAIMHAQRHYASTARVYMAIELSSGRGDYSFWLRHVGDHRVREFDVDTRHWTEHLSTITGVVYA
eukprot:5251475-Pyramimonas_sp.AAC.1